MSDDTCVALSWLYGLGNNQPPPPPPLQLRRYSSLILFLKHIKFVMNILMNII